MVNTSTANLAFSFAATADSELLTGVLADIQDRLQQFFTSPTASTQLTDIFDVTNLAGLRSLTHETLDQIVLPKIQILDNQAMNGARGAYSSERHTIYLNQSLVQDDRLTGELQGVLMEEIGHSIDTILNPGGDTAGDEGEKFRYVVLGQPLDAAELARIQSEEDVGAIVVNGQEIKVEQDNSLVTAWNLGTLSGTRWFQNYVGIWDFNDYYRFNLTQTSNFSLTLNGLLADADVQLLNSTGGLIQSSSASGTSPESIVRQLTAGTYYVRVYPYSGSTNYNLGLSSTAVAPADFAGNTLGTARSVGFLSGSRSFSDFVGTADTNDYYRFDLSQTSNFNLSLNGLSADVDVQLLNSTGGLIQSSSASGTSPESIVRQLTAGTYYVRVYPYSGNTNYQLNLSATTVSTPSFNSTYGYGLVNAAAAVARALNQSTFSDVTNLGGNNWGNDLVNAPEAWARGYRGQGVVVAVLDTGVDYTHPDLNDNIWWNNREIAGNRVDDDGNGFVDDVIGWDFIGNDNNPADGETHGTHVAGTIAAENNGTGVTGVAHNARIMPIRVIGNVSTAQYHTALANGIRYAANNGADVINLSLRTLPLTGGTSADVAIVRDAISYAASRGTIVVSAAGNFSESQPTFPARYATTNGLAVGSVGSNRGISSFSNRAGSDSAMRYVVAPGDRIYSTTPGNTYGFSSGTSMASPHVAGVVALMLSANPNLTHAQVRDIITSSATRLT